MGDTLSTECSTSIANSQLQSATKGFSRYCIDLAREDVWSDAKTQKSLTMMHATLADLSERANHLTPESEPEWKTGINNICSEIKDFFMLHPMTPPHPLSADHKQALKRVFTPFIYPTTNAKLIANLPKNPDTEAEPHNIDANNCITLRDLPTVMRLLGDNPSSFILRCIMCGWDKTNEGVVEWDEFVDIYTHKGMPSRKREESVLRKAFTVFDKNKEGLVPASELRAALTTRCERLTEEEVDELFTLSPTTNGRINYEDFIQKLL
ncbi:Calcium-binding EF-hand [Pelomyxa schiedti]|nr:Calcium-binding EF-hand [Pelomyxa schiedti]